MSEFGPALELLLAAVAVDGRPMNAADAADSISDWEALRDAALKNRIVPLLVNRLRSEDFTGVPAAAREDLESWERNFQLQSLEQTAEMVAVLEDLEGAGIAASPYKGPVLAESLYGNVGLREFYDLDVLVAEEDREAASEVLLARGYRSEDATHDHRGHGDDCELHFRHPKTNILLELHWDVLPVRHRDDFRLDPLWARLVPGTLAGRGVRVLSPEDSMIVLCIHGGDKHRWVRLQMVADVARLLAEPLRWDLILQRAHAIGRSETVLLGVALAFAALGAALPPEVRDAASSPVLRARVALALGRVERLDSGLPGRHRWRELVAAVDDEFRAREVSVGSPPGFGRYFLEVLRPEWTDRQALRLPRGLGGLYYVLRPLRLLRMHGGRLLGRI